MMILLREICASILMLSLATAASAAGLDPYLEQKRQEEREAAQRQTLQRGGDVHLQKSLKAKVQQLPLNEATCFLISRIEMPVSDEAFANLLNDAMTQIRGCPEFCVNGASVK
jgi:hemolysin activation/secretion protein